MRVLRTQQQVSSILGTCLLSLAISACGGKQEAPPATPAPSVSASVAPAAPAAAVLAPASPPAAAPVAAPAPEQHRGHKGYHPIVERVFAELPQVDLSADQKTAIEAIETELKKQTDVIDVPKLQVDADIAEGASVGKVDKVKVDADVKKLVQAADATAVSVQDAMIKLHKLLDAAQRKKLVALLRAAAAEPHHGHDQGANAGSGPDEPGKAGHEGAEKLAAELGLTAEQREKLTTKLGAELKTEKANMKEHWATMQKRMKAMLDAFEGDKFDAKKAGVGERIGETVKMMAMGRVRFVEAVLAVLTAEQRSKFAEHVRQHAGAREEN